MERLLAEQTVMSACIVFLKEATFWYLRDLKELDGVDRDKNTFLLLDNCIKSLFNKTIIDDLVQKLKKAVNTGKGNAYVLICVPDTVLKMSQSS